MAKKRRVFLVVELDSDEIDNVLPPHLQGVVQRPLVDRIQTRTAPDAVWFPSEQMKRAERRKTRAKKD